MPQSSDKIISENTPIRIGLVLALVGILTTSIWWAASISTKLDVVITNQTALTASNSKQINDFLLLQERVKTLELVGSIPLSTRLSILEKEQTEIKARMMIK